MHYVRSCLSIGLLLAVGMLPGQAQEKKPMVYESPFYPLRVGNAWHYKVAVGEAPVQKVVITVEQAEPYDYKFTQDNKKEVTEPIVRYRLKVVSGAKELLEHVAVLKDGAYRFTTAGKEITPPLRFLKLPLTKGETWKVNSTSENVQMSGTFTCDDDSVRVPAGQFQAKRVSAQDFQLGTEKMALTFWFALDVGIVKQHVRVGNSDVMLELEEFKTGK